MTNKSHRNLDSAIVMGAEPAEVYFLEWRDAFIHSEKLDYEAEHSAPEYALSGQATNGSEEEDFDWEHDIKPGYALIWWTSAQEAARVGQSVKASWPDYLRMTFECRIRDRPSDDGSHVAIISGHAQHQPWRKLKTYISTWFDSDGCADMFSDVLLDIGEVPPYIEPDMIGVFVRESHAGLLPEVGVVTNMCEFGVVS